MKRLILAAALAAAFVSPAWANGYPSHGRAIDDLNREPVIHTWTYKIDTAA